MMKEDYLWDKSGHDPEIEKLESALSAFRWTPSAVPETARPVTEVEPRVFGWRNWLAPALAFAAVSAFMIVSIGIWLGTGTIRPEQLSRTIAVPEPSALPEPAPEVVTVSLPASTAPKQARQPDHRRRRFGVPETTHRKAADRPVPQTTFAGLTAEERYAYEQLMLALTITSSKLRIVKDRIEGIDEDPSLPGTRR